MDALGIAFGKLILIGLGPAMDNDELLAKGIIGPGSFVNADPIGWS